MTMRGETIGYGVFRSGDRLVGVPIANLAEVCLVPKLSKLMVSEDAAIGAFDLRGSLVPLVGGDAVRGVGNEAKSSTMAAVIQAGDRLTALALDEIVDLVDATPTETVFGADTETPPVEVAPQAFRQGFVHNGDVVSCLDAEVFLRRSDVLSVPRIQTGDRRGDVSREDKCLIFCAGGVHFAIDTAEVWATVPRRQLDTTGVRTDGGLCLGFVDHFGWRVPVVATNRFFGLGDLQDPTETEVVVLRFPNDLLLGLQVDAMERLSSLPEDNVQRSGALLERQGFLPKVFVTDDKTQIFIIDYKALTSQETLVSFSEFSAEKVARRHDHVERPTGHDSAFREKVRYLVFEEGVRRVVPARSVASILRMPDKIIPAPHLPHPVVGMFAVGSRSVPLVALSHDDPINRANGFVLLVGPAGEQVGFCVENISAIQTSEWRVPASRETRSDTDLVQFGEGDDAKFLPLTDLEKEARELLGAE